MKRKIHIFFLLSLPLFSISTDKFIEEYKKISAEKLKLPNAYSLGAKDPTLNIVEFFDYLCPYCAEVSTELKSFAQENTNTVKLVLMNLPLDKECNTMVTNDIHPGACKLSYAAYCASEQNKFLEFHEQLFSLQMYFNVVTPEKISKLAKSLKLNMPKFQNCQTSEEAKIFVKKQIETAIENNIRQTPTVFINNKRLKMIPNKDILMSLLQHESF